TPGDSCWPPCSTAGRRHAAGTLRRPQSSGPPSEQIGGPCAFSSPHPRASAVGNEPSPPPADLPTKRAAKTPHLTTLLSRPRRACPYNAVTAYYGVVTDRAPGGISGTQRHVVCLLGPVYTRQPGGPMYHARSAAWRVPHRPQAYRVRFARGRRGGEQLRSSTRFFCLAALLVAAVVAAAGTSSATAARPGPAGFTSPGARLAPALEAESPAPRAPPRLTVQLTAFSASVEEGTAWGITRSGVPAQPGTVAVDPSVIPLGSRLRIAGLPGIYRAEDTGGGIRGAHVDVFMESRAAALEF